MLEIGLGYGTLSGGLMARGASYHGVDIAEGPVDMVRHRWRLAGRRGRRAARHAGRRRSTLPFPDARFDYVYTIGCLHHTGNLPRAVDDVRRVLRPGGTAVVMLYNAYSFRRLIKVGLPSRLKRPPTSEQVAALYDTNAAGEAAPHTDYVSPSQVRRLFAGFASVSNRPPELRRAPLHRGDRLLGTIDRVLGLDLYITARR